MARSNTVVMTMKATMNGLKNLDCGITDLGLRTGIREKKATQFRGNAHSHCPWLSF